MGLRRGSPVIRSEGVTVEVGAIDEEARSLDHILGDHTQTVQNVAQLTEEEKKAKKWNVALVTSQEIIVSVAAAELQ